jgi:hypothetical protein
LDKAIEALCSEQGLDRDMVIEAMKDAVKAAGAQAVSHPGQDW